MVSTVAADQARRQYGVGWSLTVIPQKWSTYWPVAATTEGERFLLENKREKAVHRIGNLTLVSKALNPALSNDPWQAKRKQLLEHSSLRLNAHLCTHDEWDEDPDFEE